MCSGRLEFLTEVFAADDRAHVGVGLDVLPALSEVLKAAVEAELLGDPGVVRNAECLVAVGGERLGERSKLGVQREAVAVGSMVGRIESGKHRGMRGERPRRGREGVFEGGPRRCERSERGRRFRPDTFRPRSIENDENDVPNSRM